MHKPKLNAAAADQSVVIKVSSEVVKEESRSFHSDKVS